MVAPFTPPALPRFLECEDPASGEVFILHTESPRILARVDDADPANGIALNWVRGWGDPIPPDYPAATLMREMGDWYSHVMNDE